MATIIAPGSLSAAQTGTGDSTNTLIVNGSADYLSILRIANTGGSTPTVTINIQGSVNGSDWFNVPYRTTAAPTSEVVAAITVTTTATNHYYLSAGYGYKYLKLVYSANTNETITADVF